MSSMFLLAHQKPKAHRSCLQYCQLCSNNQPEMFVLCFKHSQLLIPLAAVTWQAFANSLCQLVLVMMANVFLVARLVLTWSHRGCNIDYLYLISIYSLTRSRLQSGLVLAFSSMAFIFGVINLSTTWEQVYDHRFMKCQPLLMCYSNVLQKFGHTQLATSSIWHGLQAIAECLIMCMSFSNRCGVRLTFPLWQFSSGERCCHPAVVWRDRTRSCTISFATRYK